ncbi:MAG: hypothetical protein QM781_16000 [Chitinophagaceae bacterium]
MEIAIIIAAIILSATILAAIRQQVRSKERRALIEKGLDPSLVNIYPSGTGRNIFLFGGIILLAVAIGIITGMLLASIFKMPGETKEFILLSVLISAGISLFICHSLLRNRNS